MSTPEHTASAPQPQSQSAAAAVRADNQDPSLFGQTPWQTVGPFFHFGLPWNGCADLTGPSQMGGRADLMPTGFAALRGPERRDAAAPVGERIQISGHVFDGRGRPVPDALLEIWQANASGCYRGSGFAGQGPASIDQGFFGFGRAATAEDGSFCFRTIRPGRVHFTSSGGALQAPHIALGVLGRGLLKRLMTRIYFDDEPSSAEDAILRLVPEHRRATLMAQRIDAAAGGAVPGSDPSAHYRFDVRLQGERETVFFDY
ncbi:MAG TPA: protocatechuate 3,4-dioxygenase subunit alpha [Steroidobacteraceae bacterium]|jgi:protocatechuate 3,4-dioxygenase alpha subunit